MAEQRRPPRRRRARRNPPITPARVAWSSLVLLGIIIGLGAGLYYAWVVDPVVYTAAAPARLRPELQEEWIYLASQAYAVDGDLTRARRRLAALGDDSGETLEERLSAQLLRYLRQGRPAGEVQPLAELAEALGIDAAPVAIFAPTPIVQGTAAPAGTPTATPTLLPTPTETVPPTATFTPSPTLNPSVTPSPTAEPAYRLLSQEPICGVEGEPGAIEIVVLDALLEPLPGVEIVVSWSGGEDRFYTGFKPARGPGFADFAMSAGTSYTVVLAQGSPPVSGLRSEPCDDGTAGGWELTFQNLQVGLPTPEPEETP